ncbi:hypothetical protein K402DRAFT_424853 [Aulographum hederae CBS 113979]|uniref:Ricin B lectin domain-containing protein n=1 Tax=Aulographum hederae CBS 113979 TaxID=1176131 RepID=A0A6G1GMF8_9PEZI|nr:hypothetical protein K402DRAFT_424853 [Aulographum hederae CBS 113979]
MAGTQWTLTARFVLLLSSIRLCYGQNPRFQPPVHPTCFAFTNLAYSQDSVLSVRTNEDWHVFMDGAGGNIQLQNTQLWGLKAADNGGVYILNECIDQYNLAVNPDLIIGVYRSSPDVWDLWQQPDGSYAFFNRVHPGYMYAQPDGSGALGFAVQGTDGDGQEYFWNIIDAKPLATTTSTQTATATVTGGLVTLSTTQGSTTEITVTETRTETVQARQARKRDIVRRWVMDTQFTTATRFVTTTSTVDGDTVTESFTADVISQTTTTTTVVTVTEDSSASAGPTASSNSDPTDTSPSSDGADSSSSSVPTESSSNPAAVTVTVSADSGSSSARPTFDSAGASGRVTPRSLTVLMLVLGGFFCFVAAVYL